MKEIRTEIRVNASKANVWRVLTDFAAFPEWNPFLVEVRGALEPGARVAMKVRGSRRTLSADAEMLAVVPEQELRWVGPASRLMRPLVRGEHFWLLEDGAPGQGVRLLHCERFNGPLAALLGRWLDREFLPQYGAMNEALKSRAEALEARRPASP